MKMFLFLFVAAGFSVNSFSKEIIIHKALLTSDGVEVQYNANRKLNRGWIELVRKYDDPDWEDTIQRIKIEGLSYLEGEIIYDLDGEAIVCAKEKKIYGFNPFKMKKYVVGYSYKKIRKNCQFKISTPYLMWDDGYDAYKREHLVVKMIINSEFND